MKRMECWSTEDKNNQSKQFERENYLTENRKLTVTFIFTHLNQKCSKMGSEDFPADSVGSSPTLQLPRQTLRFSTFNLKKAVDPGGQAKQVTNKPLSVYLFHILKFIFPFFSP